MTTLKSYPKFCLALIACICSFTIGFGQITQVGSATTATNNSAISTLTINRPTGVQAGDVLIVNIVQNETDNDNGGLSNASLSGWTLIDGRQIRSEGTGNGDNAWWGTVLFRIAGASEPASYAFSLPNSRADMAIGSIVAFRGVNTTGGVQVNGSAGGPFDVAPGVLNLANSDVATATSLTTVTNGAAVIMLAQVNNDRSYSNWSTANVGTLSELYDNVTTNGDDASVGAAWVLDAIAGSTGDGTVTLSASDRNAAVLIALRPIVPTAGAIAGNQTICSGGNPAAFTSTTNGTGVGTLTYRWESAVSPFTSWTAISGATAATYDVPAGLTTTTQYRRITISTIGAAVLESVPTAVVTVTVNPNLPASVSISASATTICAGTSVTFTATPTNGGTAPSYQWRVNGNNVGTNSATFTSSTLSNNDVLSVVMTSNATPCLTGSPVTSNSITMTVNPNLPASVSISASATTICAGTSVTFTATPTNGGTAPSYQWRVNGNNVGANSNIFTTSSLVSSDVVSVVMTSNATCATGSPATSNSITMTVNPVPGSVTASVNVNSVCVNGTVNLSATAVSNSSESTTLISQNFNSTPAGWTTTNTSTGGNIANAAWQSRASLTFGSDGTFYSSPDGSNFFFSDSRNQNGTTTNTTLTSPSFNTQNFTSLNLSFSHYFRFQGVSNEWAKVQVSTNGTTWNDVVTYTSNQGSPIAFANVNLNLNSYTGFSTVFVRFAYNAGGRARYWAIENVTVSGTLSAPATFAWTSVPAGFTATTQNTVATVSQNTSYIVTATNSFGCSASDTVTVSVIPTNTITRTSAAGTDAQTACINTPMNNITYNTTGASGANFAGLPAGVTGNWNNNVVTISGTPTASGVFNYTVTLTGGCGTLTATGTITVAAANTISLTSAAGTTAQTICRTNPITTITYSTTGATGATVTGLPAGVTGNWAANVVTISGTPTVAGNFIYTVTLAGGCSTVTATGTISVNEVPVAYTVTGGGAFCSGGGGNVVGLANSQTGVTYQLRLNGSTNVGAPVAGTGAAISFGAQVTAGTYTVIATNAAGCSVPMSNAVSVSVTAQAAAPVIASIIQPTCTVATATINLSGLPAGNWTVVRYPGAVATTGSGTTTSQPGLVANTTYTFEVTPAGGCTSPLSANAVVNAQPATPAAPVGIDAARCGTGTVVLGATVASGITVDWYQNSSAGTVLSGGTGTTSFTTPILTATTTYYAEARNLTSGCISTVRTPVIATINQIPSISLSAAASTVSYGAVASTVAYSSASNAPVTYSIQWNSSPANAFAAVTNQTLSGSPISLAIPAFTSAGTYTGSVTVANVAGCTSSASNFTLTVQPAALTITGLTAQDKVYDGLTSATISGIATFSGLQNGESFTVTGTASATFNTAAVGNNKPVTVTGFSAPNSNYTLSPVVLTASITAAPLTILVDDVFKTFNTAIASPGAGFTDFVSEGLVNGETIGSITLTYGAGAAANAAVGTYTGSVMPNAATGGTFTASNYQITYVPADLLVGNFKFAWRTGNWTDSDMWSSSSASYVPTTVPTVNDIALIRRNNTVTVTTTDAVSGRLELGGNAANTFGILTFATTGSPKLTVSGPVVVGGFGSINTNRRGVINFTNGATLEANEIVLTRSTTGSDNPGTIDMTNGGTIRTGSFSVGQGLATWTPGTGSVILTATSTLPASAFTAFNNLLLEPSIVVTSGRSFAVTGTMTVNGQFIPGNTAHVVSGSGTLTGNGIIDVNLPGATALTSQYSITNRTLSSLSVEYVGNGNQTIHSATYGHLVTGTAGTKTLGGPVAVEGNVLIGTGTTLSAGSNQAISVKGNWTNNGTFSPVTGAVTFNGTAAQQLTGNNNFYDLLVTNSGSNIMLSAGAIIRVANQFTPNGTSFGNMAGSTIDFNGTNQTIPAFNFFNLAINGGGSKTLTGAVAVNGQLNLVSGLVTLGNFDLIISSADPAAIAGGSGAGHIVTNGTGLLKRTVGGAGAYTLPLGSGSAYNPIGFNWTSNPGITELNGRYIAETASVGSGLPFTVFGCLTGSGLLNNGYWSIAATGTLASNPAVSVTRRGHTNAGPRNSTHGVVRRSNAAEDWSMAGLYTDSDNTLITPTSTGPVALVQQQLEAFGELAIGIGAGSAAIGIWTGNVSETADLASNWGCNTLPTPTTDVVVPRSARRKARIINSDLTVRNFTINSGARVELEAGKRIKLSQGAIFTNRGQFSVFNGAVEFEGTGVINTSNTSFYDLIANGSLTIDDEAPIVTNQLQLNNGASLDEPVIYGDSSTLVYNQGVTVTTDYEWNSNGDNVGEGRPRNVRIQNGTRVVLYGDRRVLGNLDLRQGVLETGSYTMELRGDVTDSAGTLIATNGQVFYNKSNAAQAILPGDYNNLELNNNNKIFPNGKTIRIAGAFVTGTAIDHIVTGSTIEFNGTAAQTIPAFTYHHLRIAGSSAKSAAAGLAIAGDLTVTGTFHAGAFTHSIIGNWIHNGTLQPGTSTFVFNGNSTISGSAELQLHHVAIGGTLTSGIAQLNINGNWTNNGSFVAGTGTVRFTNGAVPVPGFLFGGLARKQVFNNLTINKPGQTLTTLSLDSLVVTGNITIEAGTFSCVNAQLMLNQGNWINNGGVFTSGGSTVHFTNSAADQTISGTVATQSFAHLTVAKTNRTLSLGGATTRLNISGDLLLVSGTFAPGFGTTIAYNRNGNQNVPVVTYHNLTITGSGSKQALGTLPVGSAITIEEGAELNLGTHELLDGGNLSSSGAGVLRSQNIFGTALPEGRTWAFRVQLDGASEQLVTRGIYNGGLTLNNAEGAKLKGSTTVSALTLTTGDLSIDTTTLTLNGAFNGSLNHALRGSRKSNLTIGNGAVAGILYFKNTGVANHLRRFTFEASASASLGNRLVMTSGAEAGVVTVKSTSKLFSSGNLVLQSDSLGTARVAEIEGCTNCTAIEGEVEVERFIPAKRTWRFITIPVTGNYTLRQHLTRQSASAAQEYPDQYCPGGPVPAATGYGTLITGHSMSSCGNAAQVGADHLVNGGASSVRRYTHINGVGSWASNTNTPFFNTVPAEDGYLVFVRGDRSQLNTGMGATTFRFKGQLKQGTTTNTRTINAAYGVMSNPYAAPIDLDQVFTNGTGNENKFERNFWIWDGDKTAGVNSLGGYRSISFDGAGNYDCADCESISVDSFLRVNSGQAFMVQRKAAQTGTAVSMTVKESDKVESEGNIISFRANRTQSTLPKFRVQLHRASGSTLEGFMDGALARFGSSYSDGTNEPFDIYKYNNFDENLSLVRSNNYLSIESRPMPKATDTLYLPFWNTTNRGYALRFETENFSSTGLTAELIDQFTNSRVTVPLNGGAFVYPFTVTSAAASKSLTRFRVVFTPGVSLPVDFTEVRANPKGTGVQVAWDVANEEELEVYEVERSTDGRSFRKMAEQAPRNGRTSATYQWFDAQPNNGHNFYRIKAVDRDGTYRYSSTVRVQLGQTTAAGVRVYPTTVVQNTITVEISNQPAGVYTLQLTSAAGQVVYQGQLRHGGGSGSQTVVLGSRSLAAGTYFLLLQDAQGNKKTVTLLSE